MGGKVLVECNNDVATDSKCELSEHTINLIQSQESMDPCHPAFHQKVLVEVECSANNLSNWNFVWFKSQLCLIYQYIMLENIYR